MQTRAAVYDNVLLVRDRIEDSSAVSEPVNARPSTRQRRGNNNAGQKCSMTGQSMQPSDEHNEPDQSKQPGDEHNELDETSEDDGSDESEVSEDGNLRKKIIR